MKKILTVIATLLATVLALAACQPENVAPDNLDFDIFYTVADNSFMAALTGSGNTVHVTTDSQWDALLDSFCDYALAGEQVTFCRTNNPDGAKSSAPKAPTTISTSDREELKAWMKEMEKAGRSVNITYDEDTGRWNGRAYANLSHQDEQAEPQTYSGTFRFVPTPAVQEPPLGGTVWALEVGDDTLIITVHGMMIWSSGTDAGALIIDGAEAVLEGIRGTYTDLYGETFFTIELNTEE